MACTWRVPSNLLAFGCSVAFAYSTKVRGTSNQGGRFPSKGELAAAHARTKIGARARSGTAAGRRRSIAATAGMLSTCRRAAQGPKTATQKMSIRTARYLWLLFKNNCHMIEHQSLARPWISTVIENILEYLRMCLASETIRTCRISGISGFRTCRISDRNILECV